MSQLIHEAMTSDPQPLWGINMIATNRHTRTFFSLSCSPVKFNLSGLLTDGWMLIGELLVTLEQDEDGYYVLSDDVFLVYGEGPTEKDAKNDYVESLIEYYEIVSQKADAGDKPSQLLLNKIRQYLHPINQ